MVLPDMMIAQLFPATLSHNSSTVDYQLTSRRRVLTAVGIGTTVALAGCSGNGQGESQSEDSDGDSTEQDDGSNTDQSDSDTEDGSDDPEATGNDPGEYPTQETTGEEARLDGLADEDPIYAFKIDNYDYLNVQEFPDTERYDSGVSYREALYFSTSVEGSNQSTDEIYFLFDTREESKSISMYWKEDNGNYDIEDAVLTADQEDSDVTQEEFLKDYFDPDGIVHAVDLAEHDDAVEALHSGWEAE